jgi:protein-disulfide isomerase
MAALAASTLLEPMPSRAQDVRGDIEAIVKEYLAAHPDEVGEIVKGYLVRHPEAFGQILAELLKRRPTNTNAAPATDPKIKTGALGSAAVTANADLLMSSPHQVVLGDPNGDVTLVEFFDYNCGYCKRALADMQSLLDDDPRLRIVLKEFPILGPDSAAAARVAIAVRMQDPDGRKYLAFHRELLATPGVIGKDRALAAASHQTLDMDALERDLVSDEVTATLAETTKLASAIGVTGTPGYVVGKQVIPGAVGLARLKAQIDAARTPAAN